MYRTGDFCLREIIHRFNWKLKDKIITYQVCLFIFTSLAKSELQFSANIGIGSRLGSGICSASVLSDADHVSLITALSASTWIDILEAFQFEIRLGFSHLILASDSVISMNLSCSVSNGDSTLSLLLLVILEL